MKKYVESVMGGCLSARISSSQSGTGKGPVVSG